MGISRGRAYRYDLDHQHDRQRQELHCGGRTKNGAGYSAWRKSAPTSAAPGVVDIKVAATMPLANYPNPFNPETWIPYQLAAPAEVMLTIYDMNGEAVRRLEVGHQAAGMYRSRNRALYWDGRNGRGESVTSGLYFYTLRAGEFVATRKMLIRK